MPRIQQYQKELMDGRSWQQQHHHQQQQDLAVEMRTDAGELAEETYPATLCGVVLPGTKKRSDSVTEAYVGLPKHHSSLLTLSCCVSQCLYWVAYSYPCLCLAAPRT